MVHEQEFKDLINSTCPVSVERRVLDLESEAMRGLGSIPTGGNILSLKMKILAFLCVCEKPEWSTTSHCIGDCCKVSQNSCKAEGIEQWLLSSREVLGLTPIKSLMTGKYFLKKQTNLKNHLRENPTVHEVE